jgi:hypothetical protein
MNDDDLPDRADVWRCNKCGQELHILPPGSSPPMPWHIIQGPVGLQICGGYEWSGKVIND